jgi:hypothetical protein
MSPLRIVAADADGLDQPADAAYAFRGLRRETTLSTAAEAKGVLTRGFVASRGVGSGEGLTAGRLPAGG